MLLTQLLPLTILFVVARLANGGQPVKFTFQNQCTQEYLYVDVRKGEAKVSTGKLTAIEKHEDVYQMYFNLYSEGEFVKIASTYRNMSLIEDCTSIKHPGKVRAEIRNGGDDDALWFVHLSAKSYVYITNKKYSGYLYGRKTKNRMYYVSYSYFSYYPSSTRPSVITYPATEAARYKGGSSKWLVKVCH